MSGSPNPERTDRGMVRLEMPAVWGACALASLAATVWSWRHGALLNYGDAVAHLHIARRVFDAHQPRLTELGSVWLPLPHILLLPFVQIYSWWADGLAGVVPSALAYLAASAGLYRLARRWLARLPAAAGLAFFALNPNLLYLQTTAMTEPLFLCEMVWAVAGLVEWHASLDEEDGRRSARRLWWIAAVLVAAVFTRYDGWVMAFLAWVSVGLVLVRRNRLRSRSFWLASVLLAAAPAAWFVYNAVGFGDWLYFARGPYSALAIELRSAAQGAGPLHPGWHNPWVGLIFFVKAAEMDTAAAAWGNLLLAASALGTVWGWWMERQRAFAWTWLLWLPVPFYAYSVAYGSVPIFLPVWWPYSCYNTRYGMEMLPAFALGVAFAARMLLFAAGRVRPRWTRWMAGGVLTLVLLNAAEMVRERPLVYVESTRNIAARLAYEREIPPVLRALLAKRPESVVLMETSVDPELVALTGIPLRQTINESDLELYCAALEAPAAHAAIVLAFDGDPIDRAVKAHPEGLTAVRRFRAPGEPDGTIYLSTRFAKPKGAG
ncbi:MAG: hypothetical protein ACP5FH_01160 [Terracidiphilus sp.]